MGLRVVAADHPTDGRLVLLSLTAEGEALMRRLFPEFNAEEVFVTEQLTDEECRRTADALRRVVLQVEAHGEDRRAAVLRGVTPTPRRSGRRRRVDGNTDRPHR